MRKTALLLAASAAFASTPLLAQPTETPDDAEQAEPAPEQTADEPTADEPTADEATADEPTES